MVIDVSFNFSFPSVVMAGREAKANSRMEKIAIIFLSLISSPHATALTVAVHPSKYSSM